MKTCIHALMSFFVILVTVILAGAQELPDDAQLAAWKAFNQARGKQPGRVRLGAHFHFQYRKNACQIIVVSL